MDSVDSMIKVRALPLALLLGIACVFNTAASGLNTGWLVPAGHIRVDRQALKQPEMKLCALTFDDGPDTVYTPAIAGILDRYNVHATFFVVGTRVDSCPRVVQELAAAGHEIGNHTQNHPHMPQYSKERQRTEIRKVQHSLGELGITPRWFRPPYGVFNASTLKVADEFKLETVLWSVDPRDWAEPGVSKIQSRVLSATVPGAVILLHSTHGQTALALPGIIEGLQKKGYRFVTMTEWAAAVSAGVPPPLAPPSLPINPTPPPGIQVEPDEAFKATAVEPSPIAAEEPVQLVEESPGLDVPPAVVDEPVGAPTESTPTPDFPTLTAPAIADAMALAVTANFNGPEGAAAIFSGKSAANLQRTLSTLQEWGGPQGYLQSFGVAEIQPQVTLPAPEERASEPPSTASTVEAWTPPLSLDISEVLANEQAAADVRFRPAPQYYLHVAGPITRAEAWEGLNSFYEAAQLDGVVVGMGTGTLPANAPRARASVGTAQQPSFEAMADLSLQDLRRVLDVLQRGNSNVYLTVRASNVAQFQAQPLIARPWPQQQFVLFRQLTRGLDFDAAPENDFAPQWPLPPGVRMARFTGTGREVLALYTLEAGETTVGLPAAAREYLVPSMGTDGLLAGEAPPARYDLGRGVLLLYRDLH
jgi:peptidoglycan/xylan/chitin deacetylase (PgdA/CDA1 family)